MGRAPDGLGVLRPQHDAAGLCLGKDAVDCDPSAGFTVNKGKTA